MSKVIKFSGHPRRSVIEEAACAWLAKLEAGAGEAELKALGDWLLESSEHIEAFFEVCAAWDELSVLAELSAIFPLEKSLSPASASGSRQAISLAAGDTAADTAPHPAEKTHRGPAESGRGTPRG